MDYLIPSAMENCNVAVGHVETLSPLNPEGIKGAGEGGTMPVPAVIANAVSDALAPIGVRISELPMSPSRLWELMDGARKVAGRT